LSFEVATVEEQFGGNAGNIAHNLAMLGEKPIIISAAGEDFEKYRNSLEERGIDTSRITIILDKKTAFVNIITDLDDNQIAAFHAGALAYAPVPQTFPKEAEIAIVGPESIDVMLKRVFVYKEKSLPYVFDPAQQLPRFSGEDLKKCIEGGKILIGNDYEIGLIVQKTGLSLESLVKKVEIVIMTLGEKGSHIYTRNNILEVKPVIPKKVIDPTGAGDAYRAGFVSALLEGKGLEECGKLASWVASKAIEYYGAQQHWFTREEVSAIIMSNDSNGSKKIT
jgi:adenosine kinase